MMHKRQQHAQKRSTSCLKLREWSPADLPQKAEQTMIFLQSALIEAVSGHRAAPALAGFHVKQMLIKNWQQDSRLQQANGQPYLKHMKQLYELAAIAAIHDHPTYKAILDFRVDIAALLSSMKQPPDSKDQVVHVCGDSLDGLLDLCGLWNPVTVLESVLSHAENQPIAAQLCKELADRQQLPVPRDMSLLCDTTATMIAGPAFAWGTLVRPVLDVIAEDAEWIQQLFVEAVHLDHFAWLGANPQKVFDMLQAAGHKQEADEVYEYFRLGLKQMSASA